MNQFDIPIYMYPVMEEHDKQEIMVQPQVMWKEKKHYWGPRGTWLLKAVLSNLTFTSEDEIAILTTSCDTYVSTCVTIPCFNYATISRTVTKRTKVIILIHEFGWIMDEIDLKVQEWKKRGIIIIEDCAHICGIRAGKKMVGAYGDYTIFSIPKIVPVRTGGLLVADKSLTLPEMNQVERESSEYAQRESISYLSRIDWFNHKKYERAELFERAFPGRVYQPSEHGCPFYTCILCDENNLIRDTIKNVEFGATLNPQKLYIPLNPLVKLARYRLLIQQIKDICKGELYESSITGLG